MNAHVNKPINTCCDRCKEICFNIDIPLVKNALYAGKVLLSDNSLKKVFFLENGYIKGVLCKDVELKLVKNIEVLEKYLYLYQDEIQKCLCDTDLQQIVDNILGIADISCCDDIGRVDLIIDESRYSKWVLENPGCQVFENWERSFLGTCTKFEIKNVFKEDDPKILYEISVSNITNKCDLILAISVQNDPLCGIGNSIDLDYKVISEKENCKINLETFITLRECGIKTETISKLIDCGLKFNPNVERKSCDIYINPELKITMCDLKFSINSNNIDCKLASDILKVDLCT